MDSSFLHIELLEDAKNIAQVFSIWDSDLMALLYKYKDEELHKRNQLALTEYFNRINSSTPQNLLQNEARAIRNIFPLYTEETILSILRQIANEDNRVRIAVQILLNRNYDIEDNMMQTLKRARLFNDVAPDTIVPSKKLKVASATVVSGEGDQDLSTSLENVITAPLENVITASPSVAPCEIIPIGSEKADVYQVFQVTEAQNPPIETTNMQNFNAIEIEFAAPTHDITKEQAAVNEEIRYINEQKIENKIEEVFDDGTILLCSLIEIFPEACPEFLRNTCKGKKNTPDILHELISQVLEGGVMQEQNVETSENNPDFQEKLETLKQLLPDADPDYLQMQCEHFINRPEELQAFIGQAMEQRRYPKMRDYIRKQQLSAQQKQYTTEFNIEKFLEVIPNPIEYFGDPKRQPLQLGGENQYYALCVLNNHFNETTKLTIKTVFRRSKYNFAETFKDLEAFANSEKNKCRKRALQPMPATVQNIPLLQEIAFYKHREEIEAYLYLKKCKETKEREKAKQEGLLLTCDCCFDSEVMPKDICTCESGCLFCKECVRRGVEVAFGEGKLEFACLSDCSSHFSLQTLQAVLPPKMFSKIAMKRQAEEIKAAELDDLESCPFCDFVNISNKEDKVFRCFNPDCMKESCRLCKEPSHLPLRCDEIEKSDDVRKRTYIENKMTEALLRTCWKCQKKFIKSDGCNKMTCTCGAKMCYVCGQPVKGYDHFDDQGGKKGHLCPLYSNLVQLHQDAVLKGAEEAKQEIGVTNTTDLKIDPTADILQHYQQNRGNRGRGNHPIRGNHLVRRNPPGGQNRGRGRYYYLGGRWYPY